LALPPKPCRSPIAPSGRLSKNRQIKVLLFNEGFQRVQEDGMFDDGEQSDMESDYVISRTSIPPGGKLIK
jgi:hypothetical protein